MRTNYTDSIAEIKRRMEIAASIVILVEMGYPVLRLTSANGVSVEGRFLEAKTIQDVHNQHAVVVGLQPADDPKPKYVDAATIETIEGVVAR